MHLCTYTLIASFQGLLSFFPGRTRLFLPVIHILNDFDVSHACAQVRVAVDNGADGVFLIQGEASTEGRSYSGLPIVFAAVRAQWPDLWVGLNFMAPDPLPHVPATCNALWLDKGIALGPDLENVEVSQKLECLLADRARGVNDLWKGLVFVGFFFKGSRRSFAPDCSAQDQASLVAAAAKELATLGPAVVCCTSGPGTGNPLELDRALMYRNAVAGPIAVASGVTIDNVDGLLPFVDAFMVATGIEQLSGDAQEIAFFKEAGLPPAVKLGHLDPAATHALADCIHAYSYSQRSSAEHEA